MIGQQVNAVAPIEFTARYSSLITMETRLKFGSRTFDIIDINNVDERNREMIVMAQELA